MAVALAQQAGANDNVGSVTTLDVVLTTSPGALLCLEVSWNVGDSTTITVADTGGGNTWAKASKGDKTGSTGTRSEIWYVINAAAITKVTITQSAASVKAAVLAEFSGFGVGTLNKTDTNTVGGTATPALTNTVAPAIGDLVVATMNLSNVAVVTVDTANSWVALTPQGAGVAGGQCVPAYKLSASASESEDWTFLTGTKNWGATIASFTPAAGAIQAPAPTPSLFSPMPHIASVPWVVHPLPYPSIMRADFAGQIDGLSALPTSTLTTVIQLADVIPGQSNLPSATLTTVIKLAGQIDGVSNLPGSVLTTLIKLAGQIDALSSTSASLTTTIKLAGQTDGVSGLTATLTTLIKMTGQTDGVSGLTGALTTAITMTGQTDGVSGGTGTLTSVGAALAAVIASISAVQGALVTNITMAGTIAAVANLVADLTGGAAAIPVTIIPPDTSGAGPVAKRRLPQQDTFDDWTISMDDDAILELYLLRMTR